MPAAADPHLVSSRPGRRRHRLEGTRLQQRVLARRPADPDPAARGQQLPRLPAAPGAAGTPSAPYAAGCCASRSTGWTARPARTAPTRSPRTCTASSGLPVGDAWPTAPQPWQLRVFFPETLASRTTQWERGSDPLTRVTFTDSYDCYGQPVTQISVAVPRGRDYTSRRSRPSGPYLATYAKTDYAQRDDDQVFITDRTARTTSYEAVNDGTSSLLGPACCDPQRDRAAQPVRARPGPTTTGPRSPAARSASSATTAPPSAPRPSRSTTRSSTQAYASGSAASEPARTAPVPARPQEAAPRGRRTTRPSSAPSCPPLAGFSWNPGGADPDDHPGYFAEASRQRFDFHTGQAGAEGPPGTGVGLLQVTRDPLGNDTTHRQL